MAHRRRLERAGALVLYTVLAMASTWPLARLAAIRIPLGTEDATTVPHASAWALWWASDRLGHGGMALWDAPIYHPATGVFALSEPLLLQGLVAVPLTWLGLRPVLVYNLILLASLVANGMAARWLLRVLGARRRIALCGGAIMTLLPHAHHELGVLALVCVAPPLIAVGTAIRLARHPTPVRGMCLGLAVGASYLSCAQYGFFMGLSLAAAAPWLGRVRDARRLTIAAAAALVSAGLLIAPLAAAQLDARRTHRVVRSPSLAKSGSLAPQHLARAPWPGLVPLPGVDTAAKRGARALFPGPAKLALLGVGIVALGRSRRRRRERGFLVTTAVLLLLLAMAPRHAEIFAFLRRMLPGLAQIRSVWRAAGLAQAIVVVVAGMGLELIARHTLDSVPQRGRWRARATRAAPVLLATTLATVELWPPRQVVRTTPHPTRHTALLTWIDANVPPGEPLLFFPHPETKRVTAYANWTRWMMMMPSLDRPMIGGYSSYFPPDPYRRLLAELRRFPDGCWPSMVHELGARHAVVRRGWLERQPPVAPGVWRRVLHGDDGYDVYELSSVALRRCEP